MNRWRIQQLTNDWHSVYASDVTYGTDEVDRALYTLAVRNPYTSFRAVNEFGDLYRNLTSYKVTP